jgi:nucleotide-binding universal stress UspA family protein
VSNSILVPLDGSSLGDAALAHASAIARRLHGGLHLVRVHTPPIVLGAPEAPVVFPDPAWNESVRDDASAWLERRAGEVRAETGLAVTFELRDGSPGEQIVAAAGERDVWSIVCTTHGHGGWALQWLGSVADQIIRRAPCPVYAMTESAVSRPAEVRRILVLLDGSEASSAMVPRAAELARLFDASVELFRAVAPPWVGDSLNALQTAGVDRFGIDAYADSVKRDMAQLAADLVTTGIRATSVVFISFHPSGAILERIKESDPDVVALATYGRGLSRLFLGSVADKVLRAGGRPTFTWRPVRVGARPEREVAAHSAGATR